MQILAVSGGVDSMCLLHFFRNKEIVVAHVNYGLRENAIFETKLVENYCKDNNIIFECAFAPQFKKGNFQEEARKFRYHFFSQLCLKYECNQVVVAHHLDDVIETYFMQLNRGSIPEYYGIKEYSNIENIEVYRPLLNYTKEELYEYAQLNTIPYLEDDSNFELKYTRNKIRNQLKLLPKEKKLELLKEIENKNKTKKDSYAFVRNILFTHGLYHFSDLQLKEIEKCMRIGKKAYQLSDSLFMYPGYKIYPKFLGYEYQFNKIENFSCEYFSFGYSEDEGFYLSEDDFPITIRNWKEGDKIKQLYGRKKISRFFKDNKVDLYLRMTWPVVLNRKNEIVFVVGLGCSSDYISDKVNSFVVK